jgi:predicted enzyme related to lactoylglutathione lyase
MEERKMPTIVHFEIPTDDLERAKRFYNELFGWKIEKYPGPMEYWMITTTDAEYLISLFHPMGEKCSFRKNL